MTRCLHLNNQQIQMAISRDELVWCKALIEGKEQALHGKDTFLVDFTVGASRNIELSW